MVVRRRVPPAFAALAVVTALEGFGSWLYHASSGDVAWWTGYQIAEAILGDATEPTPMRLRITEDFRFEDGEWKLVHRHAERAEA